ncbi:helix-turn-helix transcriptional regulator [Streptomyces sp. CC208A]|uniref:helix-turn-helix domain-containing protein n=1 Tax=Streptomyces sp. CC208A TaxID=3044573 RepID=UPI0024A89EEE|nr:helix-turn-helix transcriptional regulator [Streptomyces sp. CC208A]
MSLRWWASSKGTDFMRRGPEPHGPSCARRLRESGTERGHTTDEIARTIHAHCFVSPLRAQRLARGLTLAEAADRIRELVSDLEKAPRVTVEQLRLWETGGHQPIRSTVLVLAAFYGCSPGDLGLDETETVAAVALRAEPRHEHRAEVIAMPVTGERIPTAADHLSHRVDAARRALDRTLASATVTSNQLDHIDEMVLWASQEYISTPPALMLTRLLDLLAEVEGLAACRQPAAVQVRLSELTAMLSTLTADALMKLGDLTRSRSWYATARTAADDSGNAELRARVRAQAAMLPFYYGPIAQAVNLCREARVISGKARTSATHAFAAAAEARALAKLGAEAEADDALRYATKAFEQFGGDSADDAFAFPARRYLLYRSGTLTALGRTREARQAQEQALVLYQDKTGIDPALLRLEAAICYARDRSPDEAFQLAGATFLRMDPAHRTPIVEERAREVVEVLPPAIRTSRAARELLEIIELPPGRM